MAYEENTIVVIVEPSVNPVYAEITSYEVDVFVEGLNVDAQDVIWQANPTVDEVNIDVTQVIWQVTPSQIITTGTNEFPIHVGPTPPENPQIGDLWLDTN